MALFKILRGDSTRISTSTTPFHDGYAYFTPDDGGLYIDAESGGDKKRIRVNPESSNSVDATLTAAGWSSGQQVLSVSGIDARSNGVIGTHQDITDEQLSAAKKASLSVRGQGNGTITIEAYGEVPTCDIPVTIILFR